MIKIDGTEVRAFSAQLRNVPQELRKGLRRNIKAAAEGLLSDVQANASWSSRIPDATRMRVGFGERTAGVTVYVDANKAPHARPLEFPNRGMFNRHPVFGTETWVEQPAKPFFMRAIRANEQQVVTKVQDAIDGALSRL